MQLNRQTLLAAGAWICGLTALAAATAFGLTSVADRLLRSSAEQIAIKYVHNISAQLPDLPLLFASQFANPQTITALKHMRALGDVFRFNFYDPDGNLLLASDDLDLPDPFKPSRDARLNIGSHHAGSKRVKAIVVGGSNYIQIEDGRGKKDRPAFYTDAYVPILDQGVVIGVVEVYVDSTAQRTRIHAAFVEVGAILIGALLLVGVVLAALWLQREREKRKAESRMRYLAKHDALSGALNRASFHDALNQLVKRQAQGGPAFAVLCIDLDRFKDVNDMLGHAGGDSVLRETTSRLQGLVRHGDLLARLGGDEFAILQSDVSHADDVRTLGQRVVDALAKPHEFMGRRVMCGSSVGAARFGVDATTVEDLLHKADVAMYCAKTGGRGRFNFYDRALDRELEERRELGRELRDALVQGHLAMHYQAIFAANNRALLGYEALMRWNHPTRGAVPPSIFIPLAEQTGQIESLGRWALEQACIDAAGWPAPLSVSVNLSAAQFRGELDLVQVVADALAASGLPGERLVLEITESLLMNDTEAVISTLNRLAAQGVNIPMDDFGTGYSSLAYLWRFRFDKVKIDRAFTHGLADDKKVALIVRSIVSLAHSLGIRVNAEGVETEPQAAMLRRMGCDELQGFLLGRPAPEAKLDHHGAVWHATGEPGPSVSDFAALETQPMPP